MLKQGLLGLLTLCLVAACGERELILTGERLDVRADLSEDAVASAAPDILETVAFAAPPQVVNADWSHRAAGPTHLTPHAAFSDAPQLVWSVPIGQGEDRRRRITADPVVADGRVFTVDSGARVMAHSTSGAPLWSRSIAPNADDADDASGAGLAAADGRLFVSTAFGTLVALDATSGSVLWVQDLDAAAAGAPTVDGDTVYVVARDALAWAINAETGKVRWTLGGSPNGAGIVGGAAPAVGDGLAVLPFASREIVGALKEGGTQLWLSNVAGTRVGRGFSTITDISGDPVIANGVVYAGSPSGRTNAFDLQSGDVLWSAEEGALSAPLVAGGSVFVVTDLGELVRLDGADGTRLWGAELPFFRQQRITRRRGVEAHFGPILAGDRLWVASSDGVLRGFAPESGALDITVSAQGGAATNPVVADRTLYVVSRQGRLLAFR